MPPAEPQKRKPRRETPAERAEKLAGVQARVVIAQARQRARALEAVWSLLDLLMRRKPRPPKRK